FDNMPVFYRYFGGDTNVGAWQTYASREWAQSFGLGVAGNVSSGWPNQVTDLNDVSTPNGMYYFATTATGNPTGTENSGSLIIQRAASGYIPQFAQPVSTGGLSSSSVRLYARHYRGSGSTQD